jgi:ribonuclease HI
LDPKDPTYKPESSSFALERDALDHLYPVIAESPELRFEYEIKEAVFSSNPFSDLGLFPRVISRYNLSTISPDAVQVWTDGSLNASDLKAGTACLIWSQGYDNSPLELTGVDSCVFSSTQVEMIALTSAFEFVSEHSIGKHVQIYSDSLAALTFLASGYWKSWLSDTKQRLRIAYAQACHVSTIQLIHVPGHKGIWQNERADRAAKTALKTLTTTNVNADISQAVSFARDFYVIPPRNALRPAPRTITKQT